MRPTSRYPGFARNLAAAGRPVPRGRKPAVADRSTQGMRVLPNRAALLRAVLLVPAVPSIVTTSVQAPAVIAARAAVIGSAVAADLKSSAAGPNAQPGAQSAEPAITNPVGRQSRRGFAASLQIKGTPGLTYRATGLPAGLTVSPPGQISGTGQKQGTSTVTVTGTSAAGGLPARSRSSGPFRSRPGSRLILKGLP